jgi:uncharacterized protein (TIGR03032 family)
MLWGFPDARALAEGQQPARLRVEPGFAAALARAGGALAMTAAPGGLFLLGPPGDGEPPGFAFLPLDHTWGLAAAPQRIAVATAREIVVLANTPKVAASHPDRPDHFDAVFSPRLSFFTGDCLLHDMAITRQGLLASNTRFSTVAQIDGHWNFDPVWQPPFITAVLPEDRCHLNGIAVEDGVLRYVTAFGICDTARGWREAPLEAGVVLDVQAGGRVLRGGLYLPHSPRLVDGRLLVAEAGRGCLLEIDRQSGAARQIAALPGFTRGIAAGGGVIFVGLSRIRGSARNKLLPLATGAASLIAGIAAVEAASGAVLGFLHIEGPPREVFDLALLPGIRRAALADGRTPDSLYAVDSRAGCYWMRVEGSARTASPSPKA